MRFQKRLKLQWGPHHFTKTGHIKQREQNKFCLKCAKSRILMQCSWKRKILELLWKTAIHFLITSKEKGKCVSHTQNTSVRVCIFIRFQSGNNLVSTTGEWKRAAYSRNAMLQATERHDKLIHVTKYIKSFERCHLQQTTWNKCLFLCNPCYRKLFIAGSEGRRWGHLFQVWSSFLCWGTWLNLAPGNS